jgi:hypothetical protein
LGESDFDYYSRRADEEMMAAVKATSVVAAQVHRAMAARFRSRAVEATGSAAPLPDVS